MQGMEVRMSFIRIVCSVVALGAALAATAWAGTPQELSLIHI